ncbi:MAG: metal ABC transporter permease [Clostridia bacterium]|nr:metal ABC transporter permease [Clostridia bacterium]MBR3715764.1 metal ABC transporter permease [Clostridia bacterium]
MSEFFARIAVYLSMDFVKYSLIAGLLIALCSSLLGVTLVLKRYSMIGDGLSHVAFGAMTVAAVAGLTNEMIVVLPVTVVSAVLLLRLSKNSRVKADAAIAMISVGSLAVGYLLTNIFSSSANINGDVCGALFGSVKIISLSKLDVWLCVILSVIVIGAFLLFYNKIFAVTFDEDFASATGVRVSLYNTFIAVISAVVIVLAMNLVGALLVSALIVFPAITAMRIFRSFRAVTVCAAAVSVFCVLTGLFITIIAGTPAGATIVAVNIAVYFVFSLVGLVRR